MRLRAPHLFLTFVSASLIAAFSHAAPTTDVKPGQYNQGAPTETPDDLIRIHATRVVRDKTYNVAVGLWSGNLEEKNETLSTQVVSFTQTFQRADETALEFGFDVTMNGQFGIHGQSKKYCCMGEYFEPYWTVGAQSLYKPSEQLAGFVKIDSYWAVAGGGVEDFMNLGRRLRIEGLAGVGVRGTSVILRIGYAFEEESAFSF
ncbi:MAG: hypothetical protein KF681_06750 [Bdellovibrionaceae bacterium]|nr:hypothetical protein [Pseudobdellovibrionaceae bacterium]